MVQWEVKGREFVNCNCDRNCPCQFNALPTHGDCRAVGAFQIQTGHYGNVTLDGLTACMLVSWPGPIHQGNGTMQLIVDERADAAQRDALLRIMQGQDTREMATMWWIFSAMAPTKLDPIVAPIELDIDVPGRRARLRVPGVVESTGEPILNPVTGKLHRVRIDLPEGFEFRVAEIGLGTTRATAGITLDLHGTYGQFADIHLTQDGVVR
ncbi:MAG TPA: DUF1326 domain-containing protein [Vicinamibacterales bacterium]|nr:DUF1326 domain-containing protein [Vicinamibacterales bacterium]